MSDIVNRKTAVVFDPHPDDADFWTGGLTVLLVQKGWTVHYVCCGTTDEKTRREAEASAKVLGCRRHFWELTLTGNSSLTTQLCEKYVAFFRQVEPSLAFIPALTDYHHEHVSLSREFIPLFKGAGRHKLKPFESYCYDSHDGRDPIEIYLDITDVFEQHMQSLRCHESFRKLGVYAENENTLTRVKTGRSMVLGASMPHPTRRALNAEGYRMIWGHPTEVTSLKLLFPERFCYRSQSWLTSMWYT